MWLYRKMLRISWKEHNTNGEVLHKIKTKRSLLNTIKKRKCQYFGHIIRGNGVQRLLMEGRINGRRGRGDREQCGRITSRNGQKYHIMTASEWHKIENDGNLWQPTCWLQMAHNEWWWDLSLRVWRSCLVFVGFTPLCHTFRSVSRVKGGTSHNIACALWAARTGTFFPLESEWLGSAGTGCQSLWVNTPVEGTSCGPSPSSPPFLWCMCSSGSVGYRYLDT